ncbi:Ig-like domain-containing protein, partial [Eisenbergiella sp. OF01-20]|uniref:Ig-like domain-containing protein n=2 Tax=unclassified Eisenbergiella TaxID=2652273 RepID=UPI0015F99686
MIRKRKKRWALFLSAVLIAAQLPAVAMAENKAPEAAIQEDGSIASFEPLDEGVKKQSVPVGTELSGLNLPDTVTGAVYHVTEETVVPDGDDMEAESVSGNDGGDSSHMDRGETVTAVTTSMEEIHVTWDSGPAYDGDAAGRYVFTADVGGYPLS